MSSYLSEKSEEGRQRLLSVIKKEFKSNAEFCRQMHLSHNWVNDFKNKKKAPSISSFILSDLYELKNISPLWVTNGVGPYKVFTYERNEEINRAAEPEMDSGNAISRALAAIRNIEQQKGAIKDIPLSPDLEIELAELLLWLLKRRSGGSGSREANSS